ncbi:MAG: peptide chain release factor N(5)-glutamine methyltransferase [Chloroherpetonaceae bacterium]|nr:peptide chain release factor N(5)-glutamine methyltransferase [Chthonomonadaceae bacterium]MDW8206345.1 peptide chain release factor N(5)-glutamine methyltransferase [Chloroherpetonaceae bacterium]
MMQRSSAGTVIDRASIRARIQQAIQILKEAGIETPRMEAQLLLAQALGVPRSAVLAETYPPPDPAQLAAFDQLVRARARRTPLAYLRGTQEFYGLDFEVTPAVLIPRPETELLVEIALEHLPGQQPAWIADAGTGSGCIVTSILAHRPAVRAIATDCCTDALRVAQRNAILHAVAPRVRYVCTDFLSGLQGPFQIILSNPPYIPAPEIPDLPPEVRLSEPRAAIDGGQDGLNAYRRLIPQGARLLCPEGLMAVEVARGQASTVADFMKRAGLTRVEIRPDLAGIPRIVYGYRSSTAHV